MIDKASVFAERFKSNPQILQATVLGQGPDPSLDPYTALRALQLIKESNAMAMARQAQQPTSAPSLVSQAIAPQGLAAMGAPVGPMAQAPQDDRARALRRAIRPTRVGPRQNARAERVRHRGDPHRIHRALDRAFVSQFPADPR